MPACPPQWSFGQRHCTGRSVLLLNVCLATKDHETLVIAQNVEPTPSRNGKKQRRGQSKMGSSCTDVLCWPTSALFLPTPTRADIRTHATPRRPSNLKTIIFSCVAGVIMSHQLRGELKLSSGLIFFRQLIFAASGRALLPLLLDHLSQCQWDTLHPLLQQ